MNVAVDTNIIAYVEGINAGQRRTAAIAVLDELRRRADVMIPVQALGELFNVLVRKAGWPREAACTAIAGWYNSLSAAPTTTSAMLAAARLAADHGLPIWDSVMLAVAAESGCRLLLSEDFQDGFTWGGVTVINPFAAPRHPLLEAALAPEG